MYNKMHQQTIFDFFQKRPQSQELGDKLPSKIIRNDIMDIESMVDHDITHLQTQTSSPIHTEENNYTGFPIKFKNDTTPFPIYGEVSKSALVEETKTCNYLFKTPKKNIEDYFGVSKKKEIKSEGYSNKNSQTPQKEIRPKNFKTDTSYLVKWLQKNARNQYSWQCLPKELMRRIMSFLPLEDNARVSSVCRYWYQSYKSIWLSYDYFSKIQFKNMNEVQVTKLFENGGRLPHIKKMKNMLCGKKVAPFFKKNKLSTKISNEYQQGQKLFEIFTLEPDRPNMEVLIIDRDVEDLCYSSKYSLLYIRLISCNLLTSRSFKSIAQCKNMQQLALHRSMITDQDVEDIMRNCSHLVKLSLCACSNLTDKTIEIIVTLNRKLESLELASNPMMTLQNVYLLSNLQFLKRIDLSYSNLYLDHFYMLGKMMIEELSIEGAKNIEDSFLYFLAESNLVDTLKSLNVGKNNKISEEAVWAFVENSKTITEITFPLMSPRIEQKLFENKSGKAFSQNFSMN